MQDTRCCLEMKSAIPLEWPGRNWVTSTTKATNAVMETGPLSRRADYGRDILVTTQLRYQAGFDGVY